jgi:hypothetical protein
MSNNVYVKLQKARFDISQVELKKSGNNQHLKFGYFELQDFIPIANKIFDSLGLIGVTDFSDEKLAKLKVINTEKHEEEIVFSVEKSDAGLRSGTPIQNTGAQQTYLRRYLWVQALELTENDVIDTLGCDEKITQADANKQRAVSADKKQSEVYKETLRTAFSLNELRAAYKAIPPKFRTGDMEAFVKNRAAELTPIVERINDCKTKEELNKLCETFTGEQNNQYSDEISAKLDELIATFNKV